MGQEKKSADPEWKIRVGVYLWLLNIQGQSEDAPDAPAPPTQPPPPSNLPETQPRFDIDLSFQEVFNKIKFAFLTSGEYRLNRVVGTYDLVTFILEGKAITPYQVLAEDVQYRFAFTFLEATCGYEMVDKEKVKFDALLGLRLLYFDIQGQTKILNQWEFGVQRSNTWLDPIIGVRLIYIPKPGIEFVGYTDVGPFNPSNQFAYQISIAANFSIGKHFYISPGWRQLRLRSAVRSAIYDGRFYGPFVRFGVQF